MTASTDQCATRATSKFTTIVFLLVLVGVGSMLYYYAGFFMPRVRQVRAAHGLGRGYAFGADFYPIWLTSGECLHPRCNLYSEEMTREIQIGLFGRALDGKIASDPLPDYRTFAYPAFTDLLFWPVAQIPFSILRPIVAVILGGITVMSV